MHQHPLITMKERNVNTWLLFPSYHSPQTQFKTLVISLSNFVLLLQSFDAYWIEPLRRNKIYTCFVEMILLYLGILNNEDALIKSFTSFIYLQRLLIVIICLSKLHNQILLNLLLFLLAKFSYFASKLLNQNLGICI